MMGIFLIMQMSYQGVGGGVIQYSLSANPEYVSCNKGVVINQSGMCPSSCVLETTHQHFR